MKKVKNKGFSLIEIVVVLSIISILSFAFMYDFKGWIGRYRVESQIKEMYTDLINARTRAMQRGRMHFITNTNSTYAVYEDTNPAPDGNESLETGSGGDTLLPKFPKNLTYLVNWDGGEGTIISISKNGLLEPSGSIFLIPRNYSDEEETINNADFNCINISSLKIYMGKKNDSVCEIK